MTAAKGLRGPVLAAIDLTDAADEVLTQANAIAVSLRTKLIVSHVLHETLQARMLFPQFAGMGAARQAAFEQVREAVKARIAAVAKRAISEVDVVVDSGSAHAGILSRAEQVSAGLIVVGPGAVAERVARYAPCAVLVARPSPRGTVLGATDFSDPSLPAIETAVAEARRRGVTLRLMHCLEFSEPVLLGSPSMAIGVLPALPGEVVQELDRDAHDRLRASLERFGVSGECLVTRGTAALSVVEAAKAVPTELVVVGMRGRSNLSRLLLGSVAEAILRTAPCSAIVVHLAR
jgi:nucleotide-binding universal stress UspA family protein